MFRPGLAGTALAAALLISAPALAQGGPTLPTMPRPPSFSDPAPSEAKGKAARKPAKRSGAPSSDAAAGSTPSFERSGRYVPAEFDRDGRRDSGAGARPMMTPSGRAGMGMQF